MSSQRTDQQFAFQTSRYRPRASFKKGSKLVFRRRLSSENRSMLWIHKERHAEIEALSDATGQTMVSIADTLLRFALSNMVVITDEGQDIELRAYLNDQLGVQILPDSEIAELEARATEKQTTVND